MDKDKQAKFIYRDAVCIDTLSVKDLYMYPLIVEKVLNKSYIFLLFYKIIWKKTMALKVFLVDLIFVWNLSWII